ncbi:UNVERIFIED_CONTAM: Retrovirus-related Pol polyprotein from transposon.6 [Sesamum radiatum]|uniref:Retrovirus-related Pol polyprotein from transposon.6 n=1 Tax=Sesamum radiatum TaxID=300843 RepID=A0AAW2PJ10_SESRA
MRIKQISIPIPSCRSFHFFSKFWSRLPSSNREETSNCYTLITGAFISFLMPPKPNQALEEAVPGLTERMTELHTLLEQRCEAITSTFTSAIADLQQQLRQLPPPSLPPSPPFFPSVPPPNSPPPFHLQLPSPSPLKLPKLHMPSFDGTQALDWIFQAEQYFSYYHIPSDHRLDMVAFCMTGEALSWFKWMHSNRQLTSWEAFTRALKLRFGPSTYDNHQATLFKLRQRGSVADFQAEFERKFSPGHRCRAKHLLLLLPEDDDSAEHSFEPNPGLFALPSPPGRLLPPEPPPDQVHFQLSNAAIAGANSPRVLCLCGFIREHSVTVLIDSGSSHNIIQSRVTEFVGLQVTPTPSFPVLVGNGESLRCSGFCAEVPITLQSHKFSISLYLFPIHGADVLLGVQWLSTLGPFLSDYSVPSIQFYHNGGLITLSGNRSVTPHFASFAHIQRFLHTNSIEALYYLSIQPAPTTHPQRPTVTLDSYPPDLSALLHTFHHLFQLPQNLPPPRPQDHHIHLLPHHSPVNIKPYRYPFVQKDVMSNLISEMLREGIIRPSTSPFSSPVLLVKRKDGTWRFCVDYRALNSITVKDRFPIPTVDELLDELHGATIFSKLDLHSGYHQIRVAPDDVHKTAFHTVDGHFEFLVMPFGLSNAPATFQAVMNEIFQPLLPRFVLVFFDDILIYSTDWSSHLTHLGEVLQVLSIHKFFVKLSKCSFAVASVEYLGHIISAAGLAADPSKLRVMVDWPTPTSLAALRGFLGLTGYYRHFVRHYASIAAPLTDLLRKQAFS